MSRHVIKQVLNYRRLRLREGELCFARGTPEEQSARDALAVAKVALDDDGHSGGSYMWTKQQSIEIDQIGWEKWLASDAAQSGYRGIGLPIHLVGKLQ